MGNDIQKPIRKVVRVFHPLEDVIKPVTKPLKKVLNKTGPIGVRIGAPPSAADRRGTSGQVPVPQLSPFTCNPEHMVRNTVAVVQSMVNPERKQAVGRDSKLSAGEIAALAPIYQWSDGAQAHRCVLSFDAAMAPGPGWSTNAQPVGWVYVHKIPRRSFGVKRWRSPDNSVIVYTAGIITPKKTRQRLALGATIDDGIVFYIPSGRVGNFIHWASHGMPPLRMFSPV